MRRTSSESRRQLGDFTQEHRLGLGSRRHAIAKERHFFLRKRIGHVTNPPFTHRLVFARVLDLAVAILAAAWALGTLRAQPCPASWHDRRRPTTPCFCRHGSPNAACLHAKPVHAMSWGHHPLALIKDLAGANSTATPRLPHARQRARSARRWRRWSEPA